MSMSVSDTIKESSISFNSTTLINNNSSWTVTKGNVTLGSTIIMGSKSKCSLTITKSIDEKFKCQYLKLLAKISSNDTTLSTENVHKVSVSYDITYVDDKGIQSKIVDCYYPKYDFEDDYTNDYSIISVPDSSIISITVTISNNEDEEIKVLSTGLYYSKKVDEEMVSDIAKEAVEESIIDRNPEIVEPLVDMINEQIQDGNIYYLVPEMTLEEWEACDKTQYNECIIIG